MKQRLDKRQHLNDGHSACVEIFNVQLSVRQDTAHFVGHAYPLEPRSDNQTMRTHFAPPRLTTESGPSGALSMAISIWPRKPRHISQARHGNCAARSPNS